VVALLVVRVILLHIARAIPCMMGEESMAGLTNYIIDSACLFHYNLVKLYCTFKPRLKSGLSDAQRSNILVGAFARAMELFRVAIAPVKVCHRNIKRFYRSRS
jgi:hypothetical protein